MKAWEWLKAHWQVPFIALVAVLGALGGGLFVRELRRPDKTIKRELEAVRAGEKAARGALANGSQNAVAALEDQHAEAIKALDQAAKTKLDTLKADPRAFAKHLSKLSS